MELTTARTSPHFEIRTDHTGARLSLIGEIDYDSEELLSLELERAALDAPDMITIDMSAVTFTDSVAIRVLLTAQANSARIVIDAPSPAAQLLLDLPCLQGLFEITTAA